MTIQELKERQNWNLEQKIDHSLGVIDRFFPSSKTCSNCGWKNNSLKLSDRVFKCKQCGTQIDRDLNAALNIQAIGVDVAQRMLDGRNPVVMSV